MCTIDLADKSRIEKFLKHVMIEEYGVYTLLGSKPMTTFALIPIIDEVEKREIYESMNAQFKKSIPFEKFKPIPADNRKLWNDWRMVEKKYLGEQFVFIEDESWGGGLFINIPAVIYILEKYYDDFSKITCQAFDPMKAVHEIGLSSSSFWSEIKKSHYLLGLLLGFGEKNAKYFQWENEGKIKHMYRHSSCDFIGLTGKAPQDLSIEDLDIPAFIVYQPVDEQVEKFRLEREKFLQIYKDQDFAELTMQFLKGIKPSSSKKRELSENAEKLIQKRFWNNSRYK